MCPFTETSSQGFGSRLGSSLTGLLIGPLLVIGAIVLLCWNEGRAVQGPTLLWHVAQGGTFALGTPSTTNFRPRPTTATSRWLTASAGGEDPHNSPRVSRISSGARSAANGCMIPLRRLPSA